jgi:hypothetical protein
MDSDQWSAACTLALSLFPNPSPLWALSSSNTRHVPNLDTFTKLLISKEMDIRLWINRLRSHKGVCSEMELSMGAFVS